MEAYSVVLFKCKWFDTNPKKKKIKVEKNITSIAINFEWYEDEPYILASQAKQVFYIDDLLNSLNQRIVGDLSHRGGWDIQDNDIEPVVLQDHNSSNFILTVELGELESISYTRGSQSEQV